MLGKGANELKQEIEQQLDRARSRARRDQPPAGAVDITLPGRVPRSAIAIP